MIIQRLLRTVQAVGDMWYNDKIELYTKVASGGHDANFNPINPETVLVDLGRCKIHGNPTAKKINSADGEDRVYSYQVVIETIPSIFPKLGDKVRITKSDGSISGVTMTVNGFGTMKGKASVLL